MAELTLFERVIEFALRESCMSLVRYQVYKGHDGFWVAAPTLAASQYKPNRLPPTLAAMGPEPKTPDQER